MIRLQYTKILIMGFLMAFAPFSLANAAEDASSFPSRAITLVVPFSAGGDTDLTARIFAKELQTILGQAVAVLNVSGASGSIASTKVKDSAPDGYTLMFHHSGLLMSNIGKLVDYTHRDFTPIAGVAFSEGAVWLVNPASNYETLQDLVDDAKKRPGEVILGVGLGSQTHAHAVAFERAASVTFNIVDVGGISEKNVALMGGHIDVTEAQFAVVNSFMKTKRLRAIATPADQRYKGMPDVPTFKESGYDFSVHDRVFFIMAPPNTPQPIADKLDAAIKAALDDEKTQAALENIMITPAFMDGPSIIKELDTQFDFLMQFQQDIIAAKKK